MTQSPLRHAEGELLRISKRFDVFEREAWKGWGERCEIVQPRCGYSVDCRSTLASFDAEIVKRIAKPRKA